MTLKTILVCLTTVETAETLMKAAVPLARRHGAHLIGLHTTETLVVYPSVAMHIPGEVYANFNASQNEQSAKIRAIFEAKTKNEDFVSEWRQLKSDSMTAADRMVESARAVDLVIMAQATDGTNQENLPDQIIRGSGRPVLVVPTNYDGPEIGSNIVLGWSATREATRAAHDLLLVAEAGASVNLLSVSKSGGDELADHIANEVAENYARHGLKATIVHRAPDGQKIAEVLMHEAFEAGADVLVTGAFGHSRSYDFVIGASTHALLRSAKLPVLFSK